MQTSKQYHSLALWVIMLISLSLLSACGGGGGDSNLDGQASLGNALTEGTDMSLKSDVPVPGITLNENLPAEWQQGVDFATRVQGEDTTTQQSALTIASLFETYNDKYSGAKVTENGQEVGVGLIRDSGEALFVLDFIPRGSGGMILGNIIVLDPLVLDNYVGDYGCGEEGCKYAMALGYLDDDDDDKNFYYDVKININLKNEGNKLIASVPAWFVSDRFNSAEFTGLDGESEEFSKNGNDEYFSIFYRAIPNTAVLEYFDIEIQGRLFAGSTNDVFIAGRYDFEYIKSVGGQSEKLIYYGVYALEKTN